MFSLPVYVVTIVYNFVFKIQYNDDADVNVVGPATPAVCLPLTAIRPLTKLTVLSSSIACHYTEVESVA